jgi:hypothetical protein
VVASSDFSTTLKTHPILPPPQAHDAHIWGPVVQSRWKALPLAQEAVALAGSRGCIAPHRAFALQKQASTVCPGWSAPCELEIAASLRRIGSCLESPSPGAGPGQVIFLLDGSGSVGGESQTTTLLRIAKEAGRPRLCVGAAAPPLMLPT